MYNAIVSLEILDFHRIAVLDYLGCDMQNFHITKFGVFGCQLLVLFVGAHYIVHLNQRSVEMDQFI